MDAGDFLINGFTRFYIGDQDSFMGMDSNYEANWTLPVLNIDMSPYTERGPIAITGDAEFLQMALIEGWSGSGTEGDPYLIADYWFNVPSAVSGINITDVSLYFTIDNCVFRNENETTAIPMGCAIFISNSNLVSIRDVNVVFANTGIRLISADNVAILDSAIYYCDAVSIWAHNASGLAVRNSTIQTVSVGIFAANSSLVEVSDCKLRDFEFCGIFLEGAPNSTLVRNNCTLGSLTLIYDLDTLSTIIMANNSVNGLPVIFVRDVDMAGGLVDANAGQIIMHNVTNAVVRGFSVTPYETYGVFIGSSNNIIVEDSAFSCREICVPISNSHNITVRNCTFSEYTFTIGVYLDSSNNCTITGNSFSGIWIGTDFDSSSYNRISFNTFEAAIGFEYDATSSHNTYMCNMNDGGHVAGLVNGDYNTFISNNITPVTVANGSNPFIIFAYDQGTGNVWSTNGAPHGYGNYWGPLNYSQDDGIYTTAIALNGTSGSFDYFPLAAAASLPSAPLNITASTDGLKVTLNWKRPATVGGSAISYTIIRSDGSAYGEIAQTSALEYNDTSVQQGKTYAYIITATNLFGEGPTASASVSIPAPFNYFLVILVVIFVALVIISLLISRRRR